MIATNMHLEKTVGAVVVDVKKLMSIAGQHGGHLRELFALSSTAASKAEVLAAVASMKNSFQHFKDHSIRQSYNPDEEFDREKERTLLEDKRRKDMLDVIGESSKRVSGLHNTLNIAVKKLREAERHINALKDSNEQFQTRNSTLERTVHDQDRRINELEDEISLNRLKQRKMESDLETLMKLARAHPLAVAGGEAASVVDQARELSSTGTVEHASLSSPAPQIPALNAHAAPTAPATATTTLMTAAPAAASSVASSSGAAGQRAQGAAPVSAPAPKPLLTDTWFDELDSPPSGAADEDDSVRPAQKTVDNNALAVQAASAPATAMVVGAEAQQQQRNNGEKEEDTYTQTYDSNLQALSEGGSTGTGEGEGEDRGPHVSISQQQSQQSLLSQSQCSQSIISIGSDPNDPSYELNQMLGGMLNAAGKREKDLKDAQRREKALAARNHAANSAVATRGGGGTVDMQEMNSQIEAQVDRVMYELEERLISNNDTKLAKLKMLVENSQETILSRVSASERKVEAAHQAMLQLDEEHSALLFSQRAQVQEHAVSTAAYFSAIDSLVDVVDKLQAGLCRQEGLSVDVGKKVARALRDGSGPTEPATNKENVLSSEGQSRAASAQSSTLFTKGNMREYGEEPDMLQGMSSLAASQPHDPSFSLESSVPNYKTLLSKDKEVNYLINAVLSKKQPEPPKATKAGATSSKNGRAARPGSVGNVGAILPAARPPV